QPQRLIWMLLALPKSSCEYLEALFRQSGSPRPQEFELLKFLHVKAQEQWQLIEQQAQALQLLEQELEHFKAELIRLKEKRRAERQRLATRSLACGAQRRPRRRALDVEGHLNLPTSALPSPSR
ncbi:HERC2, partial [Symbiodinium pilosum]